MRVEINIPDTAVTAGQRRKYAQLAKRLESEPTLIDHIQAVSPGTVKSRERRSAPSPGALTEPELSSLAEHFPGLLLFESVTDEEWARIDKGIRQMRKEGFRTSA